MNTVFWHDGGQMFAGDTSSYEEGWYLLDGSSEPIPVVVFRPFTDEPLAPNEGDGLLEWGGA